MPAKKAPATTAPPACPPPPTTDAAAAAPKKPRAPRKPAAAKAVAADGEAKKRNMSAVSGEFVSNVSAALPEELKAKLKVKDIKEICETFVKVLVDTVKDGKTVNFTNHMSFARRLRAARVYQNLKTQEKINKSAHYVLTMTVKPNLKKQFDTLAVA